MAAKLDPTGRVMRRYLVALTLFFYAVAFMMPDRSEMLRTIGDGCFNPFWTAAHSISDPSTLSPHSDSLLISIHNLTSQLLSL